MFTCQQIIAQENLVDLDLLNSTALSKKTKYIRSFQLVCLKIYKILKINKKTQVPPLLMCFHCHNHSQEQILKFLFFFINTLFLKTFSTNKSYSRTILVYFFNNIAISLIFTYIYLFL